MCTIIRNVHQFIDHCLIPLDPWLFWCLLFSLWHFELKLCGWQEKVFQINVKSNFLPPPPFLWFFVWGNSGIILIVAQLLHSIFICRYACFLEVVRSTVRHNYIRVKIFTVWLRKRWIRTGYQLYWKIMYSIVLQTIFHEYYYKFSA